MVTVNAAAALNGAGSFATSRRGGLSHAEVDAARAKLGSRATAAQIAKYTGRCEADIRPMLSIVVEVETELQAEIRKAAAKADAKRKADEARDALRMSQDAEFAKLWADRMPIARMATHFGVGFNRVRSWAKRLGLPQRPPGRMTKVNWTPELDALVQREYIAGGKPAKVVAKTIPKATTSGVIGRAHRLGYSRGQPEGLAA